MIGFIAVGVLVLLGLFCAISPKLALRAENRDDPQSVSQVRKTGLLMVTVAIGAGLLMMKYEMF